MSWIRLQDVLKTKKLLLVKSSIVHVSGFLDLPGIKTINLCFVLHSFKEMTKILNVIFGKKFVCTDFQCTMVERNGVKATERWEGTTLKRYWTKCE